MSSTPWLWEVNARQAQLYRTMPEWNPDPIYNRELLSGFKVAQLRGSPEYNRSKHYMSIDRSLKQEITYDHENKRIARDETTRMEKDLTPDETGSAGAANDITVQVEPSSSGTRTKILILAAGGAMLANFAGLI